MAISRRLNDTRGLVATMRRARLIAPMRPDRMIRMGAAMRREGMSMTSGFAGSAQRCPDRAGLIDELGTLTWREMDRRADAFAAALQKAGLLAADVLSKKDVDKAIADRAEWRADERRWCREGKLPQPGWWPAAEERSEEDVETVTAIRD